MSVPPMRWTGLLLALLILFPTILHAQAFGRVRSTGTAAVSAVQTGRSAATQERVVTRRAIGIGAVHGSRSFAGKASNSPVAAPTGSVTGAATRAGTVVPWPDVAGAPKHQSQADAHSRPQEVLPVRETATLAWKPGGIRITGWTDGHEDSGANLYGTVTRPDCEADGLNAACLPEDLYEIPRTIDAFVPAVIVVPLFGPIYPLSYSYYYDLPFPPLALSLAPIEAGAPPCAQTAQTPTRRLQHQRRRSSRLFGWLYRSVRNVDMEKSSAPHLFYLRSPLLAGFGDDMDCPPETERLEPGTEACSVITVRAEKEAPRVAHVALPVLDAHDSADLRDTLETRLGAGEAIVLSTLDGKALLLSPNHVRELDVRPCAVPDPESEEDGAPTFAY